MWLGNHEKQLQCKLTVLSLTVFKNFHAILKFHQLELKKIVAYNTLVERTQYGNLSVAKSFIQLKLIKKYL